MNTKLIDDLMKNLRNSQSVLDKILIQHGISVNDDETAAFKTECTSLKNLRVAIIADAFTLGNFESECCLFQLTSENWQSEIDDFCPDMLFIESAWEGKNKSWYKKIANGSKDLYDLSEYCRKKSIPVIFWNKEDPVYTDTFMSAAACADFVFTTDFDCIERYKRTLEHNNVYLLHFSAQPLVHNPLEIHERKDKFCFAGAYYHRYRDRSRVFDAFSEVFDKGKGLEIYDRNLGSALPEHAFPARYNKMIVGNLKPNDIHIAYKGYNYGINMNSVSQSQTMFARRVFELLCSNTVCVGNYSRGTKNLFGDLTVCTDDAAAMERQLAKYCSTDEDYRKYRLLGLRSVLRKHLCEDRLGFIAKCVFGNDMKKPLPEIYVFSDNDEALKKQLYKSYKKVTSLSDVPDGAFVAFLSENDYYSETYFVDLVLSVRYYGADGFGKNCFYTHKDGSFTVNDKCCTYKPCSVLSPARSIVKKECINNLSDYLNGEEVHGSFLCTDEFGYCEDYNGEKCAAADDIFVADKGINIDLINTAAKEINYAKLSTSFLRITPQDMYKTCVRLPKNVETRLEGGKFIVLSSLQHEKAEYISLSGRIMLEDIGCEDKIEIMISGVGELKTECFCTFYDSERKKVSLAKTVGANVLSAAIPYNAVSFSVSLRVSGSGSREISAIIAGVGVNTKCDIPFLSRSETAVVADRYPSYDDLYKYMFVHKRNNLYKENALVPDMLSINMYNENRYREFEGINVTDGAADTLSAILESGRIKNLCVHFLNPYIWDVVKNYLDEINLIVFSHGSDIQKWHRRSFNYKTQAEADEACKASAKREAFWKEVFEAAEDGNIHFVYVSEYFKNEVEEDYGVDLSGKCTIIHNCIDTDMFSYEKKDASQRFSIMSVKSFSAMTYANDITQQAIIELSREKEFGDMTIDLYGDGERFETDTKKLAEFKNVHVHRGFLTQAQIAGLHKTHGIYIATTRMDTQGVSRDEAMASGLVPVATAVAAIPEFVDSSCGILVPPEDPKAVAAAILKLVRDEKLFLTLSENAARHVREKTAKQFTIDKETQLIESRKKK